MLTILVSGASSVVGMGILKSLRQSHPDCQLIGTTIYEHSAAQAFCDVFERAPLTASPSYLPWLLELINRHSIDLIIPGIEADMLAWNQYRQAIARQGTKLLVNTSELINLCADKWAFYEALAAQRSSYVIPTSITYNPITQTFPVLLKPRQGSGSRGIVIAQNAKQLEEHLDLIGSKLIMQPVIGSNDAEFTTSAFFDNTSNLCCFMTLRRSLSKQGYTELAETVDIDEMQDALEALAGIFNPVGPTNFQFRVKDGQLKLLEINPRISSATSIRTAFGYNESAMSVDYFLSNQMPVQPCIKKGRAARYIEDMIYFDSSNL